MDKLIALKTPLLWLLVIGVSVLLVLVGSGVRVPGLERQIAVSKETRDAAATARAPTMTRGEAIEAVRQFILSDCSDAQRYLASSPPFEATFMSAPVTNDHHERGNMEWTVDDPLTNNKWRLYEMTGEVIHVLGEC